MKNYIVLTILLCSIMSCSSITTEMHNVTVTDSLKHTDTAVAAPKPAPVVERNPAADRIARFIAGLNQTDSNELSHLQTGADWKNFKVVFDSLWVRMEAERLNKQRKWVGEYMKEVTPETKSLFYPFSGADFLNSNVFFPDAEKTVMIGLEPAGNMPDLNKFSKDSLDRYFGKIRKSLYSILKFSFYQTKAMAKDFKNQEIDGTLPNILIFLARNGNTIADVAPVNINNKGVAEVKKFSDSKNPKYKGLKITYFAKDSEVLRELLYFSADISNLGFRQDTAFFKYLSSLDFDATFLKSASFLMHKDYFSDIRTLILNKSEYVLQDDSGVPFRFFKSGWNTKVFGTYDRPIALFSNYYQEGFKKAYADTANVGKLPFGIGYDWKTNQSNLMLAKKNRNKNGK